MVSIDFNSKQQQNAKFRLKQQTSNLIDIKK